MSEFQTVRARERQGSRSLDLTIPTSVVDGYKVKPGDLFAVSLEVLNGEFIIQYRRVYKKND